MQMYKSVFDLQILFLGEAGIRTPIADSQSTKQSSCYNFTVPIDWIEQPYQSSKPRTLTVVLNGNKSKARNSKPVCRVTNPVYHHQYLPCVFIAVQNGYDPFPLVFQTNASTKLASAPNESRTRIELVLFRFCRPKPMPILAIYSFARRVGIEPTSRSFGDSVAVP